MKLVSTPLRCQETHQPLAEQVGRQLREKPRVHPQPRAGHGRVERRAALVAEERQGARFAGGEIDQGFARECNSHGS
jgi:hypothetical protein